MAKSILESLLALLLLLLLLPVMLIAAVGIKLSSRGPVFFKAKRAGLNARSFVMLKFRTMHQSPGNSSSAITSANDNRVYGFGSLLRKTKVDELPQLISIIAGDMSFIGPRPEDLEIVKNSYKPWMMETLEIKPGLASPGSIFNYTHGEDYLQGSDTVQAYIEKLLPIKLAIEIVYLRKRNCLYDLSIAMRTICIILLQVIGKRSFKHPPEFNEAEMFLRQLSKSGQPLSS